MIKEVMVIKSVISMIKTKARVLAYTGVIRQYISNIVGKYFRSMSDDDFAIH